MQYHAASLDLLSNRSSAQEVSMRSLPISYEFRESVPTTKKIKKVFKRKCNRTNKSKICKISDKQIQQSLPIDTKPFSDNQLLSPLENVFFPYQTPLERFKKLKKYFEKQIDQVFYNKISTAEQSQIISIYQPMNVQQIWSILNNYKNDEQKYAHTHVQTSFKYILQYLQVLLAIHKSLQKYLIIKNDDSYGIVTFEQNNYFYRDLNPQTAEILIYIENNKKRIQQQFINYHTQISNRPPKKRSQVTQQINTFIFTLKLINQKLYNQLQNLVGLVNQEKGQVYNIKQLQFESSLILDQYYTILMKKSLTHTLIDQLNQKKYYLHQIKLEDPNFEETQIQKNNINRLKKFIQKCNQHKKTKLVLPSACLGCFSSHFQQYNRFVHCSECLGRFHKRCFQGIQYAQNQSGIFQQKMGLTYICQNCLDKRQNVRLKGNQKQLSIKQCSYCGVKGILSMIANNNERIHVFCALTNNLWKFQGKKLKLRNLLQLKNQEQKQCSLCQQISNFVHNCRNCKKNAHISCAYLAGWYVFEDHQNDRIAIDCCQQGQYQKKKIEKSRKFVLNYKNCAYKDKNILK